MPYMSEEGYVGLAKQTASGPSAYVTPSHYLYVNSIAIEPDDNLLITNAEIGSGRDITDAYEGTVKWSGSMDFVIRPEAIGLLILGAMGAVTSSGIGAGYGHTFTPKNNLVPLSVEKKVGDGLEVFGYNDTKINDLKIECAAGALAKGSVDLISVQETAGKTANTPTFETAPVFTFAGGRVNLDDSSVSVKNLSFEIKNNIVEDDYRIGSRILGSLAEKRRELTATIDIVPEDSKTYRKSVYGSPTATTVSGLQQTFSGAFHFSLESADGVYIPGTTQKYTLDVDIPKAVFRKAPIPTSGDDLITETLEMLPIKGAGDVVTITLRNGVSSY